jgi:hypothetical protein
LSRVCKESVIFGAGKQLRGKYRPPEAPEPKAKSREPKLKWAASQEAVTFPWLSAHSIRKRIGGDNYIVVPSDALSRDNFGNFKFDQIIPNSCVPFDTLAARVLILLVLEAALLPTGSAIRSAEK